MDESDDTVAQLQKKRDLQDFADEGLSYEQTEGAPSWRTHGKSRAGVLSELLPDEMVMETVTAGTYTGQKGFAIYFDGDVWLIKDSYGSCTYCDGLRGSSSPYEYGRRMCRDAYCVDTFDEARELALTLGDESLWGWGRLVDEDLIGVIDELEQSVHTNGGDD